MAEVESAASARGREYETIYVLRPDVARDNSEKVSNRLQEVVQREGGRLTVVESWGRRQLAYAVSKCKRGVYVYLRFVGGGRLVAEIERNLRMMDDVIKYQTVKVRDGVDLTTLEIDPEAVKFEPFESPEEEEDEESLARVLGLEEPPRERPARMEEAKSGPAESEAAPAADADAQPETNAEEGGSEEKKS